MPAPIKLLNRLASLWSKAYRNHYLEWPAALVLTLLVVALGSTQFGRSLELKSLDLRFRNFSQPTTADTSVVLIAIDNSSLEYFSSNGIRWPWPRSFYGRLTEYLHQVGAKAVIFDMLFYEPDLEREETYAEVTDGAFAEAIQTNGRVLLGTEFRTAGTASKTNLASFALPLEPQEGPSDTYQSALLPIPVLRESAAALGVTNVVPDPDGIHRRTPLVYRLGDRLYPQLALASWLIGNPQASIRQEEGGLRVGERLLPTDAQGNYLVNWYGQGGPEGAFRYIPFAAVAQAALAKSKGVSPLPLPDATFQDKYVIIGASASGLMDFKTTPLTGSAPYPGMEIWATLLSNFLQDDSITQVPSWVNYLSTLGIILLTLLLVRHLPSRYGTPLLVVILGLLFSLALYLWAEHRILVHLAMPVLGAVVSYAYISGLSFLMERQARRQMHQLFGRYVHPGIIKNLMKDPEAVEMGGDEINVTVLFSDIYHFTNFSEGKSPRQLVRLLNEYFEQLAQIVLDHDGMLDKYTGDGIMALFGAPLPFEDERQHARLACSAALAHRRMCRALQASGTELSTAAHFHINTRLGLNSGLAVAGNIGSSRHMDFTAIGDTVNLAARLEGINKVYRTNVIMGQSTHALVGHEFICRQLDLVRVVGKQEPTALYELLGQAQDPVDQAWIAAYHQALALYQAGQWQEARVQFETLVAECNDSASAEMASRCQKLMARPPENWEGIWTAESK